MSSPAGLDVEMMDLSQLPPPPAPPSAPGTPRSTIPSPPSQPPSEFTSRANSYIPGPPSQPATRSNTAFLPHTADRSDSILPPPLESPPPSAPPSAPPSRAHTIIGPPPTDTPPMSQPTSRSGSMLPPPPPSETTLLITLGATRGRRVELASRVARTPAGRKIPRRSQTVVARPGTALWTPAAAAAAGTGGPGNALAEAQLRRHGKKPVRAMTVVEEPVRECSDDDGVDEFDGVPEGDLVYADDLGPPPSYPNTRTGTIIGPPSYPPSRKMTGLRTPGPPSRRATGFNTPSRKSSGRTHTVFEHLELDLNPAITFFDETNPHHRPSEGELQAMYMFHDDDACEEDPFAHETPEERERRLAQLELEKTGKYCLCISRFSRLLLLMLGLAACILLIVIGASLLTILDNEERDYLSNAIPLTSSNSKFSVETTQEEGGERTNLYLWNFTNLASVLTLGVEPHFEQVGPFSFNRLTYRIDVDETSQPGQVRWKEFVLFQPSNDITRYLLNQPIITFNVNYLGGMAQTARYKALPETPPFGFIMPQPHSISTDSEFLQFAIGGTILPNIQHEFLEPSSTLQGLMRVLCLPFYAEWTLQRISTILSITRESVLEAWSSGQRFETLSTQLLFAEGFGLPGSLSNPTISNVQLWSQTNEWSFMNQAWLQVYMNNTLQVQHSFMESNGLTLSDMNLLQTWLTTLLEDGHTFYERTSLEALNLKLETVSWYDSSNYQPQTWSDLGALQFGTGLFGTILSKDGVKLEKGLPTSMIEWVGKFGGINGNELEPMEFPLGTLYFPDTSSSTSTSLLPGDPSLRLPISNSTMFLETFSNLSPIEGGSLYEHCVRGLGMVSGNRQDRTRTPGQRWKFIQGALPPIISNTAMKVLTALLSSDATNAYAWYLYLDGYLGNLFLGRTSPTLVGGLTNGLLSTGTTLQNGGLFNLQTCRDHTFGYRSKQGRMIGGILEGQEWIESINLEEIITKVREEPSKKYEFIQESGMLDISTTGQYVKFRGYSEYQYGCEFHESEGQYGCIDTLTTLVNNYQIWNEPELVTGSSDGSRFPPFHETQPHETLYLFIEQLKRVLPFQRVGESSIQGLTSGHYELDPTTLNSTLSGEPFQTRWRNDVNYHTSRGSNVPDGFINLSPLQGGVPMFVSLPHMLNVDASERNKILGQAPSPDSHTCSIDVEPLSGWTVKSQRRLQANVRLDASDFTAGSSTAVMNSPITGSGLYAGLFTGAREDHVFMPYYWREELSEISSSDARHFTEQTFDRRKWAHIGQLLMVIPGSIGVAILVAMLGMWCRTPQLPPDWKPTLTEPGSDQSDQYHEETHVAEEVTKGTTEEVTQPEYEINPEANA